MTLTPVQQSAYDSISRNLETGFLNGIDEGDLNAIRGTLDGLNAADTDAVIDAMATSGKLQTFADESNEGEFLGLGQDGFSTDERRSLFADLAGKLDGTSLAAVSDAFAKAEEGHTDFDVVTELAGAVATHASSPTKLAYVEALSGSTDGQGIRDVYFGTGGSAQRNVDSEAGAIGTVIGSMSGYYAERALESLDDKQLGAVLETGIDERVTYAGASVSSSFDTARYEGVMRAATSTSDPDLKARVFDAGTDALRTIRDSDDGLAINLSDEALGKAVGALQGVIDSDTTGVVRELAYNSSSQDGSALAAYAQVMIETGRTEQLAEQMSKLQFGNAKNENAVDRLDAVTTRDGQQFRENAGALGYFVGAVYAGATAHSSNVKEQQEAISGFLNFVAGKIPIGRGLSASDAMLGQDLIKKAVESAINDPKAEPAQRLERAALPQNAGGELAVGDAITSAFDTTLNRVMRSAAP